jgi:hypothetical protein
MVVSLRGEHGHGTVCNTERVQGALKRAAGARTIAQRPCAVSINRGIRAGGAQRRLLPAAPTQPQDRASPMRVRHARPPRLHRQKPATRVNHLVGASGRVRSRDHLDDAYHALVLVIDSMAVIDEATDDHRIGERNHDLQNSGRLIRCRRH